MEPTKIPFHFIKSNAYRVVHVDGAVGGLTPNLNVFVSMYSERPPIPELQVMALNESGGIADEVITERVTKQGVVREVEVGLVMTVANARSLIAFLQSRVALADEAIGNVANGVEK